jgi:hypothetical protein
LGGKMPPRTKNPKIKNKQVEDKMNALIDQFKPKWVVIAQTDIVGYRLDEQAQTLHFLSQEDADAYTEKKIDWNKIDA